jgi:hypothetical protein
MIVWSFEKYVHGGCRVNGKDWEDINRIGLYLQHLLWYVNQREDTLNRIVTGDESWVQHYQPESKRASVQGKHPSSLSTKKFNVTPSAGKVMLTVFRDSERVLWAYFQKYVNCELLLKLWDAIHRKLPGQLARGALLHHDNSGLHTAWAIQERIKKLQWKLLEYLPYRLDLAPSDFNLFALLKNHLGCKRFADGKEVETELWKWLRQQSKDFYAVGFDAVIKWLDKCISTSVNGGYVEK